jgi:hypothetical protein
MIQMPRRSVTRFFIPLIDVLILLFCIYLLLPIVKPTDPATGAEGTSMTNATGPLTPAERQDLERLRREIERNRREIDRLRQEKADTLQRLAIRVLEIDADTGRLFYYEPKNPERMEIATEAQARSLIERQKAEVGNREIYYLFLFPRKITPYPERKQVAQYERWFKDVPYGIDNPRAGQ